MKYMKDGPAGEVITRRLLMTLTARVWVEQAKKRPGGRGWTEGGREGGRDRGGREGGREGG